MVERVAGQTTLPEETITTVVERTGGVPLLVEELTREPSFTNQGSSSRSPIITDDFGPGGGIYQRKSLGVLEMLS
jgi:hypothetical protein